MKRVEQDNTGGVLGWVGFCGWVGCQESFTVKGSLKIPEGWTEVDDVFFCPQHNKTGRRDEK